MNINHKMYKSEEYDGQNRFERTRERRNAVGDTSVISMHSNTSCQNQCYHQLAERVRELEKEIAPDLRFYKIPSNFPSFSPMTPCSNISGGGMSNYSRPHNFPINLVSPNSSVPTQRFGLSSKVFERAHQIPERFWIDWQQKQMQNRIEELEHIKHNLTSPNELNHATENRRKSLLSLHNAQHLANNHPRSLNQYKTVSTSIDTETSSSNIDDHNLFSFDQRSLDDFETDNLNNLNKSSPTESITPIPFIRQSQPRLDRSRLSIFLPFSHTNLPEQTISPNKHNQSFNKSIPEKTTDIKDDFVPVISSASSIEDVAQIDTELNLTLLLRENQDEKSPLLYSKAIINRTIEFRSSKKDPLICQNGISMDEEMVI